MGRGMSKYYQYKSSSKEILKYCSMILNKEIKFSFNVFHMEMVILLERS